MYSKTHINKLEKVIDLTNDGSKSKNKQVQNVKIFIYNRYTPRLYLILKLSVNSFITNTLDAVKLFKKKKLQKGWWTISCMGGVHQFMLSTTRDQYHSENPLKKNQLQHQQSSINIGLWYRITQLESCEDGVLVC